MYRVVAIFFLLWTLADLTVPQVCLADFDTPANGAGVSNGAYHQDDDCFCCCSHVMPSSFVLIERLKPLSSVEKQNDGVVPNRPTSAPFHPPRIRQFA
jgi:hypothetical protein